MGFDSPPVERIAWHEGMLLVPQHLQQLCARMDSLVAAQVLAARPVAWGLGRLVLDEHLLPAGRLRVLALDAILPDGTLVSYEAQRTGAAALELDLLPFQDALQDGGLDVYRGASSPAAHLLGLWPAWRKLSARRAAPGGRPGGDAHGR
jgi:type VI secretion system protein ImpJ